MGDDNSEDGINPIVLPIPTLQLKMLMIIHPINKDIFRSIYAGKINKKVIELYYQPRI